MRYLMLWCSLCCTFLSAQSNFDLSACLDYARSHNLELQNSQLNEQQAHYEKQEVVGALYPQISGAFSNTYNGILRTSILPGEAFGGPEGSTSEVQFGTRYESTASIQVNQQLYNPSVGSSLKLAEQNKLLQQTAGQQTEEQLAYNIAILYYNIIIQDAQQTNLEVSAETLDSLLRQGQLQLEQGVARQVDVDRLQVNANALHAQIEQLKRSREQLLNNLKLQVGMPLAETLDLQPISQFELERKVSQANNSANVIAQRPDIRMMEIQFEMNDLQRRINQQGYIPTLSLNLQGGSISNRDDFGFSNANWNDYLALTVNLSVPIFDGFQRSAKNQQLKAQATMAENNLRLTEQRAWYELENAKVQYDNTNINLDQQRMNVDLASKVFDVSQLEYTEGIIPATTLTEARNDLTEAQNLYFQTLLELLQARLEMAYAQGQAVQFLEQ
ncbi:MAG: TolC family protein [Bacteroidota bacterium]